MFQIISEARVPPHFVHANGEIIRVEIAKR
jgi:hypothetical protein